MESKANDLPQQSQQQQQHLSLAIISITANNGTNSAATTTATACGVASTNIGLTTASTATTVSSSPTLAATATAISATTNAATAFSGASIAHHNIHQMQQHTQHPHQQHHQQHQLHQQHSVSTSSSTAVTASSTSSGSSAGAQQTIEKLSRPAAFDKMESLVREMQDPEHGVPVRQQKMFLTSIPYAFMGYDLIEWLMDRLLIEESEALSIANQLCLHGYFFPVNDTKTLVVKDDSSLYRFQTPYYWPWQHKAPDNVEYAIYLAKRSLRNKQRHALEDYEVEALSSLHKNLKGKWDIISMQAEEQVRLAKERKKGDKIVGDSQERAYWRVHRPPPGQFTPLEPCPVPMRDRQGAKPKKKTVEDVQREVDYLRKTINRTRMKMSKACESLVTYAETFTEYDAFMQPPLPSNPWVTEDTTFWQLNSMFVDIPTEKRVRRWAISIEELVSDPTGLQEFTNFLEKEYSHENIRFWNEVNCLRRSAHSQVPRKATEIYEEFLMPGAPCEINIDSKTMASVLQALYNPSRFTFDSASEHIYTLLLKKDCYPRFIRSDHYKRLLENGIQPLHKKRFFNFGGVSGAKKKMTAALSGQASAVSESSSSSKTAAAIMAAPPPGSLSRRRGSDRSLTGSAHELAVIGVNKDVGNKVPHSHSQSNLCEMPYSESVYRGDLPTRQAVMDACIFPARGIQLQATQDTPKSKVASRLETTAETGGNAVCPWDLSEEGPASPAAKPSPKHPAVPVKKSSSSGLTTAQVQLSVCPWEQDTAVNPPSVLPTVKSVPPRLNSYSTSSDIGEVSTRLQRTSLGIRHQNTVDSGETGIKRLMPTSTEQRRASMSFTPSRFYEHSHPIQSSQVKTLSTPSPTVSSQIVGDTNIPPFHSPMTQAVSSIVMAEECVGEDMMTGLKGETELPKQRSSPSPSSTAESISVASAGNHTPEGQVAPQILPQDTVEEPIKEVKIELIETTGFVDPCKSPQHAAERDSVIPALLSRSATPAINVQECAAAVALDSAPHSNSNSSSPRSPKATIEVLQAVEAELEVLHADKSFEGVTQPIRCSVPPPLPPVGPMEEEQLERLADEEGSLLQEELSPTADEYQEGLQFGADNKDDYDYDMSETDSCTGYIPPAPTPAPSLAPLAELDVDSVDDEPPLEEPPLKSPVAVEPTNFVVETFTVAVAAVEEGKKRRKKRDSESKRISSEEKEKPTTSSTAAVKKGEAERNTVCPWEDENVSPSDGTFVKTYATLGYL